MNPTYFLINKKTHLEVFTGLVLPEVRPLLNAPDIHIVGAVKDHTAIGALAFHLDREAAELLSIAVSEEYRRQGVATHLLCQCVRLLRRTSVETLQASLAPQETVAAALLSSFGLISNEAAETVYYRFPLSAADKIAAILGNGKGCMPLGSLSKAMIRAYLEQDFHGNINLQDYDSDLSQALIENGKMTACLLVERSEDSFSISWVSARSQNKLALRVLLGGLFAAAKQHCTPETMVDFTAYGSTLIQLTDKLIGDAAERQPMQCWSVSDYRFRLLNLSEKEETYENRN